MSAWVRNPYPSGSVREGWQRGYEGRPMLAHPGSDYAKAYKEGASARKAPAVPAGYFAADETGMPTGEKLYVHDGEACPDCGTPMQYEDGEPWGGPSVGCADCGSTHPVEAAPTAPAVPAGWKLVPITPTRKMLKAGDTNTMGYSTELGGSYVKWIYSQMLATAPAVPVPPLLTDAELIKLAAEDEFLLFCDEDSFLQIARAVEALARGQFMGEKPQ